MKNSMGEFAGREVSERRQVGDAESLVNMPSGGDGKMEATGRPWWRNVGMEEGL